MLKLNCDDFLNLLQFLFGDQAQAKEFERRRKARHRKAFWVAKIISVLTLVGYGLSVQLIANQNAWLGEGWLFLFGFSS